MYIRLLGPIEASLDGRPVALGAPQQRAVLAMLALRANRTVSVDELIDGLWGETAPASAPKLVQLYVSQLRKLFAGDDAQIVTRGRGYELRLDADGTDTARFERLVAEAVDADRAAYTLARDALALWRGPALADLADEPFAAAEIRRLEDLRLRATELAIESGLAAGRHRELIAELDALVAAHPLSERLHAQRMLALYRCGRQAEALEAYRHARAVLVDEVGVEPGSELRALHDAVLRQDRALDLAVAEPALPPRSPPARGRASRAMPRPVIAVGAVLVLAGAVAAFAVSRTGGPDRLAHIDENAVGVIDPDDGTISAQFAVGRGPSAVTAGGGSVWVANTLDGTVTRIDRQRDRAVTIPIGGAPSGLAFSGGSLWASDGEARSVAQVDPGANQVVQRIEVGNAPRAVAAAGGALWVASSADGAVRRVDLEGGQVTRSIPIGSSPTAVAAGAGAIWVTSEEAGTVTRIDARSGTVVRAINVGNGPSAIATGEGAVWVVNRHDGTLSRIDPATNAVSGTVRVGRDPTGVTARDGAVWVAGGEERTVTKVDPEGPRVIDAIEVGSSPAAIATAGGAVWTAVVAPQAAHRGGVLHVLLPGNPLNPPNGLPIEWLDPTGYYWGTVQIASLAYDGLVGYRRVGGAAGAALGGALATEAPPPSRDGRTYVFTLRPGVRFSDGRLVRPEDFRASVERFLRVTRRAFPPLFAGIVGAERCIERPARCDLSAGIETDSRARTITIHLTHPDAEFLHKLANPFAYVVPGDTPVRRMGDRAPPGTGPYRIAAWNARRGGRLMRNPYFRSWSPEARPPGFADRIDVGVRPEEDIQEQFAAVERGESDLAVLANPFVSYVGPKRLRALSARSPGQIHGAAVATTEFMFLNVRRRPFDDVRVRRALNYATNRDHLAELAGGRDFAVPTCQILPTGFPGHRPYCPYTAHPTPGRGWTAPDLDRARALVAASGRAGERVVVWVPGLARKEGRYFAALLDDLGFRASLRVIEDEDYFPTIFDLRSLRQIGFVGWANDYLSPSTFVQATFTCASLGERRPENASWFCDPLLARRVERALAARGAEAAEGWAAVDRRIVDLAPAVPLSNRRGAVLVSKRVGNVQFHLQWFTLLDQLWVR
jgi:peptide/nickel transport system substrate-binding protein